MSNRSFQIHRGSLDLDPLECWDPGNGFFIPEGTFGPGKQTKRREFVTSPWVAGRWVTAIVPDVVIATVGIHVSSFTEAGLTTKLQEVLEALDQFSFHITGDQHGLGTWEWICESADWSVGPSDAIDDFDLVVAPYAQLITAQIPHTPIPVSGIF